MGVAARDMGLGRVGGEGLRAGEGGGGEREETFERMK